MYGPCVESRLPPRPNVHLRLAPVRARVKMAVALDKENARFGVRPPKYGWEFIIVT